MAAYLLKTESQRRSAPRRSRRGPSARTGHLARCRPASPWRYRIWQRGRIEHTQYSRDRRRHGIDRPGFSTRPDRRVRQSGNGARQLAAGRIRPLPVPHLALARRRRPSSRAPGAAGVLACGWPPFNRWAETIAAGPRARSITGRPGPGRHRGQGKPPDLGIGENDPSQAPDVS